MAINLQPTTCNLCGGKVVYIDNKIIYGKSYGSGYAYFCTQCGAYVGTHRPRPKIALGILANAEMRKAKNMCHDMFDSLWHNQKEREYYYKLLASHMGIPPEECHFGYFDMEQLNFAYSILLNLVKGYDG